jgi:hypothetical protein
MPAGLKVEEITLGPVYAPSAARSSPFITVEPSIVGINFGVPMTKAGRCACIWAGARSSPAWSAAL